MQTHPFDSLTLENGAKLIFTPCPGTKSVPLNESILSLKKAGTQMLLTLMFDEEMAKYNVQTIESVCADNDITWLQLPIQDDAAPDETFEKQWKAHKHDILELINKQGILAVHCKGGSGRTGLVIGLILLAFGWPPEKVIAEVQKIRPNALKHPVQLSYFNVYK